VSAEPGPASGHFGALVRQYRLALGLSQEELADRSGLSVKAIADMERGRTARPHRHSVQSLGDALGLPDSHLRQLDRAARLSAGGVQPQAARAKPLPVPRQLPASIAGFVGRTRELQKLTGLLDTRQPLGAVVISAIGGTAGVGKTTLAVHWAHQVAARFPDGQLYVNLRGYDPGTPVLPTDALSAFLRALGAPAQDIPEDKDELAARYRGMLADRRVLVVLDNARDADQVRPLLPGAAGCLVLVTSRSQLAGLVAAERAHPVMLDVLSDADARQLLAESIGPERAAAESDAVTELSALCARLPLALAVAAARASLQPGRDLAALASELRDARGRLDGLDAGEDRADVRAVFSWSFRQLPDAAGEAFALIGLHPGAELDVHATAALTGTTTGLARRVLGQLYRASLLRAVVPDRYGMHDLLRAYAREHAAASDTGGCSNRAALTRLFDYYLATAAAATDVLFPAEAHRRPRVPSAIAGPPMPGEAEARAWLDAERANLVAVVCHCADHGWPAHATGLAGTLFRYLMTGSHLPDAHAIYGHALQSARRSGDVAAEADALNGLGGIGMMKGHFLDSVDHYRAALDLYCQRGDRIGEARVLRNLGITERALHGPQSAAGYYRQAIATSEEAGDSIGAARAN
jgi:transcriptional regulator with XRE-family HTH domain